MPDYNRLLSVESDAPVEGIGRGCSTDLKSAVEYHPMVSTRTERRSGSWQMVNFGYHYN